jgi:ribose 5-phosphate isomerase A|tara:strand:- start:12732 stop:13403 length:672 start_codon:yes stop_codon:yes gene_type:complete
MNQDEKKQKAAKAAFDLVFPSLHEDSVLGIGTGSTTNFFIEELNKSNAHIKGAICSSNASKQNLKESGIEVLELNDVHGIDIYIDGADEFNSRFELIKGGGGALTREKILANSSKHFICIVDNSKHVQLLGEFPLAIEVLEVARSAVSREMMRMGGKPVYRTNFRTDNGNQIIDVSNLKIEVPFEMEAAINNIPGVVENGIFANRTPDIILKATESGIEEIKK